ncbi:hypothetical protein [Hymenobacter coccineus]|uniref:Uncharacterized protein n=1 Tax=Hymenobacter coccineus TaxID=1908235 RepID=A0A1G1TGU0_9BACT|nr:hypothetical protein [Hymenobacter coccineus]OGX90092.1 hypothetical protein BEN49_07540 [Hymenobacter coccineus]
MKTSFFSAFAAIALLASTSAFAAPAANHDRDDYRPGPSNRYDDRNSKDFNYGYDRKHRVTPREQARWEAAHRYDYRDDRRGPAVVVVATPQQQARWEAERRNNYGYARTHRVTDQERARWDAAHRYDHR